MGQIVSNTAIIGTGKRRSKFTLPLLLSTLSGQYKNQYNLTMAGALISIIPILIVYIFAQKYFKEGLTVGGVKG